MKRNLLLVVVAVLALLVSILVLAAGAAVAGPLDYWPMFNRDLQNTGVADPALTGIAFPVEMWSYTTDNAIGSGSPVIADIDGDSAPEVLVATANFDSTGGIYAINSEGSLKWKYPTGDYGTYATPPLADIDGDGKLETIFPSYGGKIVAVDDNGTQMWGVDKGPAGTRSVIADMTDEAGLEVVAGAASKTFLLKASDGTQLWQADYQMLCDPAIADVDGDSKLEVLFSTSGSVIVALNAEDGTVAWTSTAMGQDAQNNLAIISDINGDGKPDVVAGARDKKVYVFSGADGIKLWDYGVVGRSFSAAVADFNGDGYDDVATTATKADGIESYVYLLDVKNQTLLWQHNIVGKKYYSTERSPSIADVNGDCTPDVVIAGLSKKLYALSGVDGSEIWTIDTNDPSAGVPAVGDLDGDGGMEIVVSAGNSVQVFTELPPPDTQGPITSDVVADPNPAPVNTAIVLTANVDDSTTGGSNIASSEYNIDGGSFLAMNAQDGGFDQVSEDVEATVPAFAEAGIHEVCVRGTDAAGNTGPAECILLVVYDPEGGFVTGGGWIDSPEEAYVPDPALTGKATFGFVSKYKKGAQTPEGQTEFVFKVADLNFHSSSYDWLVVAGAKAMFKGIGTINGEGAYKFMLTALDADINENDSFDVDRFRIKIWTEDAEGNETVVYDNALGDDSDDATTEIGGGSIVIHTKKK